MNQHAILKAECPVRTDHLHPRTARRPGATIATSAATAVTIVAAASITSPLHAGTCTPAWDNAPGDPGLNSTVWSLRAVNTTGPIGPAVYVGGQFSTAGGATARNIARWNGAAWSPLAGGALNGGTVYAILESTAADLLYVGGNFANMAGLPGTRNIAAWNGASWSDVGGGMSQSNAGLRAFANYQGRLWAGGYLNEIGGVTAHKLASWNGATWSTLPGDPIGSTSVVYALHVHDAGAGEQLYIGGEFSSTGGNTSMANIFAWDGVAMTPLGRGTNDDVEAMATFDGDLYVGGQFTQVFQTDGTPVTAEKIARWDGNSWSSVNTGMGTALSTHVRTLEVFDDGSGPALYAGGNFSNPFPFITRWDGAAWTALSGTSMNGAVKKLSTFDNGGGASLYAGGLFTTNNSTAQRITRWTSCPPACPGDANSDGTVDIDDLNLVLGNFGSTGPAGDANNDDTVDIDDLNLVIGNFGSTCTD